MFTYTSANSEAVIDLPPFPSQWLYGFTNGSILTQSNPNTTDFHTEAANVSNYSAVSSGGEVLSGALVHTYPNYSWFAIPTDNYYGAFTVEGGRSLTLSVLATAFEAAPDALIALTLTVQYYTPGTGAYTPSGYSQPQPPPCEVPGGTEAECGELSTPHPTPTRRRLFAVVFHLQPQHRILQLLGTRLPVQQLVANCNAQHAELPGALWRLFADRCL